MEIRVPLYGYKDWTAALHLRVQTSRHYPVSEASWKNNHPVSPTRLYRSNYRGAFPDFYVDMRFLRREYIRLRSIFWPGICGFQLPRRLRLFFGDRLQYDQIFPASFFGIRL